MSGSRLPQILIQNSVHREKIEEMKTVQKLRNRQKGIEISNLLSEHKEVDDKAAAVRSHIPDMYQNCINFVVCTRNYVYRGTDSK